MNNRLRTFAALIALTTFSLAFAEGLWASMCAPGMEMDGVEIVLEPVESHSHTESARASTESSDFSLLDGSAEDPPPMEDPRCPTGTLGLGGSCVAASLPAPSVGVEPFTSGSSTLSLATETVRDLLLTDALFHPPKA